ncbi:hypothetical protein Tco_0286146 [Tanacetum coccineum]
MSRATYNTIMTRELVYTGNNIVGLAKNLNVFIGHHTFLIDFIVVEDIHEFVEKGLTEVMFGKSFKDQTGLEENLKRGVILFKVGKNKTIFNMPREERIFNKLTTKQHYMMPPILKISDEDMAKGVSQPYEKIKKFYKGCLDLVIMEYLVNISKRRAFWSLNEDILKITILKTNTPYPSRKIRCIRACIHQRPQRNKTQYAVSRRSQYAVLEIWNEYNILEDIKRGPYSKKSLIRRIQSLDTPVWKSVRYGVSKELDTAYWGFLGVGTTLDIFQNIILIPYLEYDVLILSGYGILIFISLWSLVSAGTDTPYLP